MSRTVRQAGVRMPKSERVQIDTLIPWEDNPRVITPRAQAALTESLKRFGLVQPIVVGQDNRVLGGHQRLEILRREGARDVEIVRVTLDSHAEEEALAIQLNNPSAQGRFSDAIDDVIAGIAEGLGDPAIESLAFDDLLSQPLEDEAAPAPKKKRDTAATNVGESLADQGTTPNATVVIALVISAVSAERYRGIVSGLRARWDCATDGEVVLRALEEAAVEE